MDYRTPYPFLTRDKLSRFIAFRCPSAPKDIGGKIWDACQETDINPGMMACIGMSKSKNFTLLNDVFACHIQGTFDDQIINAVIQYTNMEPEDLMLPQVQWTAVELKYSGLIHWCKNDNTSEPEPKPVPPPPKKDPTPPHPNMPNPPPPVPVDPDKPEEPKKPAEPKKPFSWKPVAKFLAIALGAGMIAVKVFAPGWVVLVLEVLTKLLNLIGSN
jgi:hypothetical protein